MLIDILQNQYKHTTSMKREDTKRKTIIYHQHSPYLNYNKFTLLA